MGGLKAVDSPIPTDGGSGGIDHNFQKRRVYFNEYNVVLGDTTYLPLVSGLLQAFAQTSDEVRRHYEFAPFLFHIDKPDTILAAYDTPDVAAFSVCMWNEQLNLRVAAEVKKRWPDCLIVFGGPQVPHDPTDYFTQHPFIDVAVRGEGEESFTAVLERWAISSTFEDLPGVSWRHPISGICVWNEEEQPFNRDLDYYPSPYLDGLYEPLIEANPQMKFQAIMETNRGCPFLCTFCYWGKGGLSRKYRYHGIDRVIGELEWCAQHQIRYVFNADSNFGMHRRDMDIARKLVDLKKIYGFPEKFRTCYGKNTDERIFEIGVLFHEHAIEKGITLSRQSNNQETLKNIKRDNIKLEVYSNLQRRFNDYDVPVYCEMILGLPGETYETWIEGVEELMRTGLKNQIFMFHCQVYPNTELADPEYRAKYGIETRNIDLEVIHAARNREGWVTEVEETVVATNTMSIANWRRAATFSWTTMLLHSMKAGFYLMGYLVDRFGVEYTDIVRYVAELRMAPNHGRMFRQLDKRYTDMLDNMLNGKGRGSYAPEYGELYWELEEMCFLDASMDLDRFYAEFEDVIFDFLQDLGFDHDADEVREAVLYQRMRIPGRMVPEKQNHVFNFSFPEYFESRLSTDPKPLIPSPQSMQVQQTDFDDDAERYAREVILWGRKSGLLLTDATWMPAEMADQISNQIIAAE